VWALLVVLALVPFVLIGGPASSWLDDLGLVDREERFTELSFPERAALPTSVDVGSPIAFDFALRNREGTSTVYRWRAVVEGRAADGSDVVLARGRVRLDDGETRRQPVAAPAPGPAGPAVVWVTLVAREEAIDFRLAIVAVDDGTPAAPAG
jgi:hypothetical protein